MTFLGDRRRGASQVAAVVAVAVVVTLGGCSPEPEAVPFATSTPTPTYISTYQAPEPTELAPLRGTTVTAGSLAHASIAAKVDNHWDARPQVGLERTDMVFEELVEGGITRYVAVWQSSIPELIGPVRSIRPMDPDIVSPFGGIICYSGGQYRFLLLMQDTPVYNAIHGQEDTEDTFFRTKDKDSPHDVLVRARDVLAQHGKITPPVQQLAYSLDAASSTAGKEGAPTASIDYRFSSLYYGSWKWDAVAEKWLRVQQGEVDRDSSGNQLSASNVVVLRVKVVDDGGVPKTEFYGSGEAWVSSGGATVHGTWSKRSKTASVQLVDDHGVTIRLAAGNTWFELLPSSGSVRFVAPPTP